MKITHCRLCQSADLRKVVDLGFHPLADTFLPPDLQFGPETAFPLQLASCGHCGHVFTMYSVSAQERYQKHHYSYDSSNSRVSIAHFREFCHTVIQQTGLPNDALVVDVGSNVGTLLSHFQDAGHRRVLGVEPSSNITDLALAAGVPTLNRFFDSGAAEQILERGRVGLLLSSNVVNHADDLPAILDTARRVLAADGRFVFEVPYLLDLVQRTAFDTIYHEHVHYYGIKPLAACLAAEGFSIEKIERLDYMCGSIRVYTRQGGAMAPVVDEMVRDEEAFGLYEPATWAAFMQRVQAVKFAVNQHLSRIRAEGGRIIAVGAATKGNTLLNYCRLDADVIAYVTDASPLKIGKCMPGSHIPIRADTDIDGSVTHALILPWNIADFLKAKLAHLGLQFYVPQVDPHPPALRQPASTPWKSSPSNQRTSTSAVPSPT